MAQKFTVPITVKQLASAGSDAVTVYVDQDTYARLKVEAGGRLTWSSGASAGDVNLYRDSANVLATDDVFKATSGVVTLTTSGAPTPALPDGALAIDTTNNAFYFRSGSSWNQVTGGGGGTSVTVSDTAPSTPSAGDLWYESDTGKMFVYYDSFWVEVGGTRGPQGPTYQTFTVPSIVNVGDGTGRFYAPSSLLITNVRASVGTAPTGASLIVDVLKNGSTIFTTTANRPTITAGSYVDSSSVPDSGNDTMVTGDYLTVSISQVGSTVPGSDLTIQIEFQDI